MIIIFIQQQMYVSKYNGNNCPFSSRPLTPGFQQPPTAPPNFIFFSGLLTEAGQEVREDSLEVHQASIHIQGQHAGHEWVDGALQPWGEQLAPPLPQVLLSSQPRLCSIHCQLPCWAERFLALTSGCTSV